jgi:hypothetical protein
MKMKVTWKAQRAPSDVEKTEMELIESNEQDLLVGEEYFAATGEEFGPGWVRTYLTPFLLLRHPCNSDTFYAEPRKD